MTPEAQRIAIAESVGWDCDPREARGWRSRGQWAIPPCENKNLCSKGALPDYLNDLNPWLGIERGLSQTDRETYQQTLIMLCQCPFEAIHALAHQRAEAYLRTLGLWTDNN
jgi:hypothetical protein